MKLFFRTLAAAFLLSTAAFAEPVEQRNFTTFVKSYHDLYAGSSNEIAKSEMPTKRALDLEHALGGRVGFSDWDMKVVAVGVDKRTGKGWVSVVPFSGEPSFVLANIPILNNDINLMSLDEEELAVARTLERGDRVRVGGLFMNVSKTKFYEYDAAQGKDDDGMALPKFAVAFFILDKVDQVTGARLPKRPGPVPSPTSLVGTQH